MSDSQANLEKQLADLSAKLNTLIINSKKVKGIILHKTQSNKIVLRYHNKKRRTTFLLYAVVTLTILNRYAVFLNSVGYHLRLCTFDPFRVLYYFIITVWFFKVLLFLLYCSSPTLYY